MSGNFCVAYLIMCHKNPHQVSRLISKLQSIHSTCFVHVDNLANFSPENIWGVLTKKRYHGVLGSYSLVQISDELMRCAKPANKKSSMRDVKIYGYGKTREKYNKKAVRKGRPKGRRSTVIPPRQGQAASPCLRASLTLRAASAIGQPRG